METAVITGAAGFLGSHLAEFLVDKGYKVIAIDNLITGSMDNIKDVYGRVIPSFVKSVLDGAPFTVFGDGRQTRSFCYVSDLIEGIYQLSKSDYHMPVNLGNPSEMSISELAETVKRLTGVQQNIEFQPLPEDDPKVRQPDIDLAKDILGWEPYVSFDEGFIKTIDWFRQRQV